MSERVPIGQVLSRTMDMLPTADIGQEVDKILRWIYEAEIRIGTNDGSLPHKECIVDIDNFRGKLPSDFYKINAVKVGTDEYASFTGKAFTYFNQQSAFLANGSDTTIGPANVMVPAYSVGCVTYKINGRFIDISRNQAQIGISYVALPVDASGLPMVDNLHILACATYARYQYVSSRYFAEKISRQIYMDSMAEWEKEKTRAQYIDDAVSYDEAKYIGEIVSSHYPSANLQYGNLGYPSWT